MALGLTHSALGLEHTFPPEQLQRLPLEGQLPRCPPSPTPPPPDQSLPWAASRGLQEPLGMGGTLPVVRRLRVLGQGWLLA